MENNLLDIIKTVRDLKEAKLNAVQIKDLISYSIEEKKKELIGPEGPKGETGDKGESILGPRGLPGPKGNTGTGIEKIDITESDHQVALSIHTTDGKIKNFPNIRGPRGQRGKIGDQGPQGLIGPTGPTGNPGRDGELFKFVGGYIPGKSYNKNDIVTSRNGSLYLSLKDNNTAPLDDKKSWDLILPYPVNYKSGTPTGASKGGVSVWLPSNFYATDAFVWIDNKIYRSLTTQTSTANFYNDYRAGNWVNMSDGDAVQPLLNGATNVRLDALKFIPTQYRMIICDLVCMRKSSTVADSYFKLTITCIWNGTAWIKNESSKTYFPGAPDDITFTINTDGGNQNALILGYTTPALAGAYDAAFSKVFISFRGII